jgi:hypothetical protein
LSLRQLVQPGCQNAINGAVSGIVDFPFAAISRFSLSHRAARPSTSQAPHPTRTLAGQATARYNPGMRRPTLIGLLVAGLLLALFGVYGAYWFVAAGRIEDGVGEWAQSLHPQNLDLSWRAIRVGGFPLAFRIELSEARLRGGGASSREQVSMPVLSASARPWNLFVWRLAAPGGLHATTGPADAPVATLSAASASGSVAVSGEGGATLWLGLSEPDLNIGVSLAAREAGLWLTLPPHPPQTHTDQAIAVALDVTGLTLPVVPAPLRNPVDEIALGTTLMGAIPGAIPAGPPRQTFTIRSAAAGWRDAGGTLELDHFAVRWGTLAISGSGTLALDPDLQPIGAISGTIEGYDQLMNALVAAGRMRAGDAQLARLALGMLAKPGADGRPAISTSFTIQNGAMYLGPAKLGKAPRIAWE